MALAGREEKRLQCRWETRDEQPCDFKMPSAPAWLQVKLVGFGTTSDLVLATY